MRLGSLLVSLCLACAVVQSAAAAEYSVPGLGAMVLEVPEDWSVQDKPGPISTYLQIRPKAGDLFILQITSNWWPQAKLAELTAESVKERVDRNAKSLLPEAIETEAQLTDVKGDGGSGYYFSFTSRKSGGYRYLTQGTLLTKVGMTTFTLMHREPGVAERERALEMLRRADYSREAANNAGPGRTDAVQVVEGEKTYRLWVPTSRLYMDIPRTRLLGLVSAKVGGATGNPRYFHFVDRAFHISGWFEPAEKFSGIEKFWQSEMQGWKQHGLPAPSNVVFTKIAGWDAIIYDNPSPLGNNSHIRAHWVQAGTWIDIHISFTLDRPSEQIRSTLETYLKGVLVQER